MAGKDIVAKVKEDLSFLQDSVWREQILGVLLYGSQATGESGPRSDIDLCIVAPCAADRSSLWRRFVSHLKDSRYDVRIFELLPLFLKAAVIEQGIVVYCEDEPELYEYFYPFRRDWQDQKHRQEMTPEEARELFRATRRRVSQSSSRA
ncbi:MAG: nucleotidyltransferase domain-containing protein [Methanothrix sp.]|nr:nucleotidyltransferase domain-containing protein [Methanothrix sp.]MDD4447090.1 nucleotidyltransferase domain-containing protein [Methanothrix sp.]